jgi:hypothetical protein
MRGEVIGMSGVRLRLWRADYPPGVYVDLFGQPWTPFHEPGGVACSRCGALARSGYQMVGSEAKPARYVCAQDVVTVDEPPT